MPSRSTDIYALTNPALGAIILYTFLDGYFDEATDGAEMPILYLPMPFVLSSSILGTFSGTNSRTGFLVWVTRNPSITVNLARKIEQTASVTREGLLFGLRYGLITMLSNQKFVSNRENKPSTSRINALEGNIRTSLQNARRLGGWLGQLNSTSNAFHSLGISI